ncbi:hypothetical protein Ddye_031913 [Dipteronia dyeriana]|uniref:Uncharacterized protein n=1 Tax=Dipteronia dyeriana TaxID=168575 RepID=A0AAD9TJF7_9ROSI|nr:hypothetical protein Ddye_031913 [Dipteronia dyeriana]
MVIEIIKIQNWYGKKFDFGNSPVSVIVLANKFHGCFPRSLSNMSETLNELVLTNNGLRFCLPIDIGLLKNLTVFDISYNKMMFELPENVREMVGLEKLNVAHNMFSGAIPESVYEVTGSDKV